MSQKNIKNYSELIELSTFEERYEYLRLGGKVGEDTFGFDRYLNQKFYKSPEFRAIRNFVISRDDGCDLGIPGRRIPEGEKIMVHHIHPITKEDILNRSPLLLDPENLICTSDITHKAIHYGDSNLLYKDPIERSKNDTCPWRR